MFSINQKTNKIKITQGDNAELEILIYDADGKKREIFDDDTIVLTMKKEVNSSSVLLSKNAVAGVIEFMPEDTKDLSAGTYIYDIQLTTFGGKIYTIVPLSYFEICQEVSK